ncbi:P-loop containing nucleoside triphosphate hydrolase protein [Crassisporium funariophilum]|nr:P-loop containing nucleoside triphosphate hydrolase protein [Crassisporium funariophilum]
MSSPRSPTPSPNSFPPPDDSEFDDDTGGGVGLSNPQLSLARRRTLDLVNRLHNTGVQVDIDLPQIAVIGNQSAGKSSLIESISGITLPRAAGTCTRCPTECRLSRSNTPWHCIVSLRFIRDAQGQPLGQAKNQIFGDIIYDKARVEERIRRAQRAILNPSKPAKHFLDSEDDEVLSSELSFSINCVSLQISGPGVADLSFCDLPGLIASISNSRGGGNDIAFVESLVTAYIKKQSCIILLAVACETDFENQGAHRLAKQYDPDGKRTIGVLTKPDRIPTGEENNWLPFIRNEKEPLENNWYCVKQPSSNDIKNNITWAQARQREDEFFSMTAPWSELDAMYQKYLRTANLVERLSSILSDLISKRLPQIQDELEKSIIHTRSLLQLLPKAPASDPRNEISSLLHVFTSDLSRHVEGVPDEDGLLQAIRPAQERFRRAIRGTAPNFRPFESKDKKKKHLRRASFLIDEEEEDGNDEFSESEDELGAATTRKRGVADKIYIDEVMERAHRARTRELPGSYPFVVQQTFIKGVIREWHSPSQILCRTVYTIISEHVNKLVEVHFHDFGQGHLEQRVKAIMQQHIKRCLGRTEESIAWFIKLENRPFSLNTHYLSDYKSKFLAHYKGSREKYGRPNLMSLINSYSPASLTAGILNKTPVGIPPQLTGIAKILSGLAEIGLVGVKPEDLPKLLQADEMEPALTIMADVRAYFQVAYKRFADNVPLAIDYELVHGIERGVLPALYSHLGINGTDGIRICSELAMESPQNSDKRADLVKKLERLEIASSELMCIGI